MSTVTIPGTTKLALVLTATVAILGLTGCGGIVETSVESTADPAPGESSSPDDGDSGSADCLIGDWIASDSELETWYSSFVSGENIVVNAVTGELLLSFSGSDFVYSTRDLTVVMTIAEQTATTRLTGGAAGTYLAEPGGIMSTVVESSDFDGTATVSGIEFNARELGIDLTGAGAFVGFQCTATKLVLVTQSADSRTSTIELLPVG